MACRRTFSGSSVGFSPLAAWLKRPLLIPSLPVEVNVWKGKPSLIKSVDDKRLRDLRAGDDVLCGGRLTKVLGVEIWR